MRPLDNKSFGRTSTAKWLKFDYIFLDHVLRICRKLRMEIRAVLFPPPPPAHLRCHCLFFEAGMWRWEKKMQCCKLAIFAAIFSNTVLTACKIFHPSIEYKAIQFQFWLFISLSTVQFKERCIWNWTSSSAQVPYVLNNGSLKLIERWMSYMAWSSVQNIGNGIMKCWQMPERWIQKSIVVNLATSIPFKNILILK